MRFTLNYRQYTHIQFFVSMFDCKSQTFTVDIQNYELEKYTFSFSNFFHTLGKNCGLQLNFSLIQFHNPTVSTNQVYKSHFYFHMLLTKMYCLIKP